MSDGGDHVRGSAVSPPLPPSIHPLSRRRPRTTHVRGHPLPAPPSPLTAATPLAVCPSPPTRDVGRLSDSMRFRRWHHPLHAASLHCTKPAPASAHLTRRRRGVALPIPTAPTTVNANDGVNDNTNDNTDNDADNTRLQHTAARPWPPSPSPAPLTAAMTITLVYLAASAKSRQRIDNHHVVPITGTDVRLHRTPSPTTTHLAIPSTGASGTTANIFNDERALLVRLLAAAAAPAPTDDERALFARLLVCWMRPPFLTPGPFPTATTTTNTYLSTCPTQLSDDDIRDPSAAVFNTAVACSVSPPGPDTH
ncbi:hypothetical protein BJ912DRAFT_1058347 [Pholiota molesta]|nr:hypothetical protein BJ912DRAFT_1058347 [Pholiota molesta]